MTSVATRSWGVSAIAFETGCLLVTATAEAFSNIASVLMPDKPVALMMASLPSVSVPVLSKKTCLVFASKRSESGVLTTTDFLVPIPVATTRLIGTAIPRAHGQAITITEIAALIAMSGSPRKNQIK